ncbi:hypothetical protein LCGC14_2936500, partial [marine sediment metagenome]
KLRHRFLVFQRRFGRGLDQRWFRRGGGQLLERIIGRERRLRLIEGRRYLAIVEKIGGRAA